MTTAWTKIPKPTNSVSSVQTFDDPNITFDSPTVLFDGSGSSTDPWIKVPKPIT